MAEVPFFRALTAALADAAAPDAELLRRFAETGDGPAFELLVRRHAGLVWRVCRAVHPADAHAAEDAFQASFLALARRAGSVREPSAAGWLFRVARHAAHRARTRAARHRTEPLPEDLPAATGPDPAEAAEAAALVGEEVGRLPARFREAVLLCFYEGCSHTEAAERLGLPVGTVASRLARAKRRLGDRLARRGVALTAAGLAALPGEAPAALTRAAVKAAVGPPDLVPEPVRSLTQGALAAMSSSKPKLFAALAAGLVAAVGATTVAALARGPADDPPKKADPPPAAKAPADDPAAKELKALAGTWRVVRLAAEGKEAPPAELEKMRWTVTGDEVLASDDGTPDRAEKIRIKLTPGTNPKGIDLTAVSGPEQVRGKTMPGIYELKGDTLTIALRDLQAADKGRPKDFRAGPDVALIVLARGETTSPESVLTALEGAWRFTRLEVDGKELPAQRRKQVRWVVCRDAVWQIDTAEDSDDEKFAVRFPASGTNWIDLIPQTGGPLRKGKPMPGVYELRGNTLTVCFRENPDDPKGRPTELKGGAGIGLFVLEKVPVR